ncbi:hypothetical protein GCK72_015169 [Caenorhabditis remanei]|uniref:Cadherin domain-containing protein n=1 Tax=Caenorhabditis remanei TaxID=31234 RepID=A0A6A5GVX9_CAERE|nr:hypothetical protein GCK72_015169 [Caenorhabditis remanei]KAF1758709.1 hypothetical protein GCK72_015169 [Caenorhabditis remanei]
MGKLEKLGRSILKKFGGSRRSTSRRRREEDVAANATSSSSTSSDEERDQGYIHKFQVVPPEDVIMNSEDVASEDVRMASPAASDEGSAGYATDDTALSSLSPLDIKRVSVDYSESQGYYSNAELSPIPRIEITVPPQDGTVESLSPRSPMRSPIQQAPPPIPRIVGVTVPEVTVPVSRTPLYTKKPAQEYPRIDVRNRLKPKPIYKSSQLLAENKENVLPSEKIERSATLSNLTSSEEEDPIERFMKSHIYKTKMITTVFEAKDRGFEEISGDVIHEIDRWFESKNMMAVACELHWSVPTSKRSRQLECKLKEKLLQALRENNKRLLYLRGMGHGKTPVKLAESKTMENISKDRETDSVRGIYQRSYTRLLPYLHKETPEWHSQYWTLQDLENSDDVTSPEYPIQPMPQKFLFDTEPSDLLLTATNSEDDAVTSSTILKVHVENLDDNKPRFLESAVPVFQILSNTSKPTAIGRLTAQDPDSNPIFYHLLPNCGSTEISKNFSIDSEFGEISYLPKTTVAPGKYELCFIVSPEKNLDTSEVFFDGHKPNFLKVLVDFVVDQNVEGSEKYDNIGVSGNQSISRVGDVLDRVDIPMLMNADSADFDLKNLQFVPANYELGRDMISPEGAVELNKKTGEIVANGKILDTPQGVYTAEISRGGQGRAMKQLHHIRNDRKLRYVLSMSRNEFGANLEKFKRQILEAIAKDDQKAGKQLDIHFDEPKAERKNSTLTSVCFYLTRENAILDDKQSSALISPSNGHISKLHHIFKVQNVDVCSPRVSASSESSTSSATSSDIPLNTLILIGVVGLLIIALVALLVFVCCVSRYQTYLKQKAERMRCSSSTGSYYKSPNLIPPPPPGYMHTPPLPPPPPPQAIAYY